MIEVLHETDSEINYNFVFLKFDQKVASCEEILQYKSKGIGSHILKVQGKTT